MAQRWQALSMALVATLLAFSAWASRPALAQDANREALVVTAKGPVAQPLADYLSRAIEEANARDAEVLIVALDTPGGSASVTFDLIQKMRASDTPIVVFVTPRGAKAASAGLLLTLAGHAAAMSPDTAIGASSPVGPGGVELPETAQQKAEEYISAEARSLAERRGEKAVKLASDAVTDARAVTASEALEAGLIDFIAFDTSELLRKLDGFEVEVNGQPRTLRTAGATPVELPMTLAEQALLALADIVADPNIAFLLLAAGILFIIVEVSTPGGWVAGTLGVVCLGFALYGIGILPVNWLGMVFIVMAFVLFVLDIKAPTHGLLTGAATISLIGGAIILFGSPEVTPFGRLSIPLVVVVSLAAAAAFLTVVMVAVRAQRLKPLTGREGLIGQIGKVTRDLAPSGMALVAGELWIAESLDGQTIPMGSPIEVMGVDGLRLRVRAKSGDVS